MRLLIEGGTIVNEERIMAGHIVVENDIIAAITDSNTTPEGTFDHRIDARGCYVLPGVIDSHVHFREPGLTEKADMSSESLAAAAGGVTTFVDMPNTVPQTTTPEAFDEKCRIAATKSHVNYAFFFGATNSNADVLAQLDKHSTPGIKLFMGSSTGNMLVDRNEALNRIFKAAADRLPVMAHCEDTEIINRNMTAFIQRYGDDPDVAFHPFIRSEEACVTSTTKAIGLAKAHGARLHVAHLSTAKELELFERMEGERMGAVTAEVTVGHLFFSLDDYKRLGTSIKVNPAIKSLTDRQALRQGLTDGRITTIGTDHAPHLPSQKTGGCKRAASGMPMIQFALVTMLELADEGVLPITQVVNLMCHNPARLFEVRKRGFIRQGYKADIAVVTNKRPWTVNKSDIVSRCAWSPMEGHTYQWRVVQTLCNGHLVYDDGQLDTHYIGQPVAFR